MLPIAFIGFVVLLAALLYTLASAPGRIPLVGLFLVVAVTVVVAVWLSRRRGGP